ncbi:hypothetical protein FRX31_027804 [Thalictrum thalictroides]|uniref:Uncharacterized protein n=1 Tax=Thalictrum thalictroides TaxID=46969 RepID=A0A7J6VDC3_THATH|nr:hypothetical protein FRX31_027804 [Thalictrum thalictroides]
MHSINEILGVKNFLAHFGGNWENAKPRTIELVDYKVGRRMKLQLDGDELNMIDLKKEILKLMGKDSMDPSSIQLSCIIENCLKDHKTDNELMEMWKTLMPAKDRNFHIFVTVDPNNLKEAEDTNLVPPISEDDEGSDMSTDEEAENVDVVPENVTIEVKQFKKLADNILRLKMMKTRK